MLVSKVDMMMIGKFIGYKEVVLYRSFFYWQCNKSSCKIFIGSIATPLLNSLGKK